MIRRVSVQGCESLKEVGIHVRPLTVIIGPNAAGKSHLLDALGLLSRMGTSETLKEAFSERGYHKQVINQAFSQAEIVAPLGGTEYGPEVASVLDLYAVARADSGFRHLVQELQAPFR